MADNIRVKDSLSGLDVPVASDDIGGVGYQRIKAGWGTDGVFAETADSDGVRFPVGGLQLGTLTETAPASDTASSGLNGRLQRIAQRLTSLIGLLPASLGQKTMANSLAVTLASDQPAQSVSGTFWQATQPVSGTFWQATQPVSGTVTANQGGTWTVQPGNTANTTAWKVDGSAVTQPVSGTVTANAGTNTSTAALGAATAVDAGDEAATDEAIAAAAAGTRLVGFSARETTGGAGSVFNIRHGTSNAGALLVTVSLGVSESAREWYGPDGIAAASGLWLERVSGQTSFVGYYKVAV
jgi:hypothetical protein